MRGGPHSDVKARHFLFCAGWWAEVDGAREGDEEMKDDMRLKSVVVKNAGKPDSTVRTYKWIWCGFQIG